LWWCNAVKLGGETTRPAPRPPQPLSTVYGFLGPLLVLFSDGFRGDFRLIFGGKTDSLSARAPVKGRALKISMKASTSCRGKPTQGAGIPVKNGPLQGAWQDPTVLSSQTAVPQRVMSGGNLHPGTKKRIKRQCVKPCASASFSSALASTIKFWKAPLICSSGGPSGSPSDPATRLIITMALARSGNFDINIESISCAQGRRPRLALPRARELELITDRPRPRPSLAA
jgi:hypothetical protein